MSKALITPRLLTWARETAKIPVQEMAFKLNVKESTVRSWEDGSSMPTMAQLEKIAKLVRRPAAVFFLPAPPKDFETLRDFRKTSYKGEYSTALTFILREIQTKQQWISDFLKEEGHPRLNFIGRFSLSTPVKQVAGDIRRELQINSIPKNTDALKYWIGKAEARGIFIAISGNIHSRMLIDVDEVRGFAITDPYAPYIFINGKDYLNSQLFTLVHELVHLWLNSSGVSNINIEDETSSTDNDEIELYCNRVAAETLMPEKQLLEALSQDAALITLQMIENLAKMFSVSRLAMLVRLFQMSAINFKTYSVLKVQFEKQFQEFLEHASKKEKQGHPDPYLMQIRKNSRLFSEVVYSSYKNGLLSGRDASELLNIKISSFNKIPHLLSA